MQLNENNGEIDFNGLKINSATTIEDLECLTNAYIAELTIIFKSYKSYRITNLHNNQDLILATFFKDKILKLSIRLNDNIGLELTDQKETKVKEQPSIIGAEHTYLWGNVYYDEALEANTVSVTLKYNR